MNDVFLSYAPEDAAWTEQLARQLEGHGLLPFIAEWCVEPGDVVNLRLEDELRRTANGIAVISPAALRSGSAMEQYAVLATESAERGLRLIPVLLGEVNPPPFARQRVWRDFTGAVGGDFADKAAELAAVVAGRPAPEAGRPTPENLAAAHPSPPRPVTPPAHPAFVVCYAPADAAYGLRLAGQLRAAGLPVWSTGDLRPGDAHFWMIRQQLRHAVAVVVVMTPASQDSDDITRMILEGQVHGRPFVPVLLDGPVNYHLATVWHVDARDGALLDGSGLDLLRTLQDDVTQGRPLRLPEPIRPATAGSAPGRVRLTVPAGLERLRAHLTEGEYEHADLLTTRLVMEAAGRLAEGWLSDRHARAVPQELLTGIDSLWSRSSHGRQGFTRQRELARAPADRERRGQQGRRGQRGHRFPELGAALGWRETAEASVPRNYVDFVQRAGPAVRPGFFPTLRDPSHENSPDWYDRWSSTVHAVHARLSEGKAEAE
ncbi:TIR domain-containing protein [Streptomyces sp. YIM S03343]